ncbi:hypothetical protein AC249_AIPGENE10979 [Exaiptasia diaphana]|nr:hypothetical protein AC249_AIPGENE10979 [Exaiptasia diaphana]
MSYEEVTLYHYTTEEGARGIKRDMKVKQNHPTTWNRRNRHGTGVYFTKLDHGNPANTLIQNNFVNRGQRLRDPSKFIDRISHVVKITFSKENVKKINDGSRDIWVHQGDIDLNDYIGRYRIYPRLNPRAVL